MVARSTLLSLLSAAGTMALQMHQIPHDAKRIHVYGVGTLYDGYGLQAEGKEELFVDPVLKTIEENAPLWEQHADAAMSNEGSSRTDPSAEAARKLNSNHETVLRDLTNGMPRSQLHLSRVSMLDAPHADAALRELSRRLLGCPAELPANAPANADEAKAWVQAMVYLQGRIQASHMDCPGREPDMSAAASAAFVTQLGEIEAVARAAMA